MTEIFFDSEDDAVELVRALEAEGYSTWLSREGFAGEDDSEDRAWVLHVEPFDERVFDMVDVYGGWLPGDPQLPVMPVFELPNEPKRFKQTPEW